MGDATGSEGRPDASRLDPRTLIAQARGRLARGSALSFSLRIFGTGCSYALQIALARWLGRADYGAYTYGYSSAVILAMVAGFGLPAASVRFLPQYAAQEAWGKLRGAISAFRLGTLVFSVTLTALVFWIWRSVGPRVADPFMAEALSSGLLCVPALALISTQSEIGRSLGRIGVAYSPPLVVRPLFILGAAGMILIFGELNAKTALLGAAGAASFVALLQVPLTGLVTPSGAKKARLEREWRVWLQVAFPLLLIAGFFVLIERIDVMMVGTLRGADETGTYNAAARSATFVSFFFAAINSVVVPKLSKLYGASDHAGLQRLLLNASRWTFALSLVAALLLAGGGRLLLGMFGEEFVAPGYAPLLILIGGHLVNASAGPVGQILNITGHQNKSLVVYAGTLGLNVVLNLALVPSYGSVGAAVATAVSMVAWNVVQYVLVVRILGYWPSFLVYRRPANR